MAIVTGDRYLTHLEKFVENQAGPLLESTLVLKLNPSGLHYVQSRFEAFAELEKLLTGTPVDYLRAYVSDLGDHRALEQLRRILRLLTSLTVISHLPVPARDPTPLSLLPFGRLKVLELRGCDLSSSAARGLLELRHTLEKIICHNSTDMIRHVFASRIAEIEDSPLWDRLQFVSCACNGLVLMDESLQLLSAVETLDLSRNKFTKVDNLRKCPKLKHLDLGFNHLTKIASLSEVSFHIVRLVLRNNVLTTLNGIENLKSLEGLDLSYNIISNFLELEILAGLPCLQSLWLEGNPICSARWYRSQVFSLFTHPDTLKLDDKDIITNEFLKMQIIIASRQKRPASFGFYSPAKHVADGEGSCNTKRKKFSRLASIVGEEQTMSSDHVLVSCDNEIHIKEEDAISDDGAEVCNLMNKVELMKKERSVLWWREFKEWMDTPSDNTQESSTYTGGLNPGNNIKSNILHMNLGESSGYVSDSIQEAFGDDSSTNILESNSSFVDSRQKDLNPNSIEGIYSRSWNKKSLPSGTSVTSIDDILECRSSSCLTGSPPHYQEDILHRRHNLVEEILQLSAESFSTVSSSDSNTSSSEDGDICELSPSVVPDSDQLSDGELLDTHVNENSSKNVVEESDCDQRDVSWGDYLAKRWQKKQKRRFVSLIKETEVNGKPSNVSYAQTC